MLRVGLLMDHPSPHMIELLEALARRPDGAVHVVYFRPGAPGRNWGNPVGGLPHRFAAASADRSGWLNIPAALRAMARVRADIWVVNTCYTAPETWAGITWLNALRLPWVYMNEPLRPRGRFDAAKGTFLRLLLARAVGVVGMGREAASRFAILIGNGKPSISVPYYLDLGEFLDRPVAMARATSMPVRFFTASQMIPRKGIDVLLAACERLPETGWSLTIAGDGPLRRSLENKFRRHWSAADGVRFLGEVPYEERAAAFSAHDVFVFPSRWDGWGMAPVEAMAAGMPVISTDQVMSMREFLRDGENGYVVASDDPAGLAERMERFLADPEKIPVMGRAARAALGNYRPEIGADTLLRLLTTLDKSVHRDTTTAAPGPLPSREDELTWRALSKPSRIRTRLRHSGRALAKRAVIDIRLASPWRATAPIGHRIMVYHLVLREDRQHFSEHIRFLRDHYRLVCVRKLVERVASPDEPPLAAITFDDGFRALMFDALELLEQYGVKATFFVPTTFVQLACDPPRAAEFSRRAHHYRRPLAPMTVDDLRQLRDLGHEIGSHGASHLGMNAVSGALGAAEIETSRAQLADWLGEEPAGFAYPYGAVDSSVGEPPVWAAAAGYRYAVTSARGRVHAATDPMLLPREHVEGNWRLRDLRYFLSR